MDSIRPPEINPALLLPANVADNDPKTRFAAEAKTDAGPVPSAEAGKNKLDLKIEQAKKQGRSMFEAGLKAVKKKIEDLVNSIKAVPKDLLNIAEEAVAESFALGARAEGALDALNQKLDAAQEAMTKKIETARKEMAARKKEAERRALAVVDRVIESTRSFFGRVKESLFAGGRRQEAEDLGRFIKDFIANYTEKEGKAPPAELLKTVVDRVLEIQEQHKKNADLLGRFMNNFVRSRFVFVSA